MALVAGEPLAVLAVIKSLAGILAQS